MATNLLELQEVYEVENDLEKEGSLDTSLGDIKQDVFEQVNKISKNNLLIVDKLDKSELEKVFMQKLFESIQIKNFIGKEDRDRIVDTFINHNGVIKEEVFPNPPIYSIGPHLYSARPGFVQEDYFDTLANENQVLEEILLGRDYLAEVIKQVAESLGMEFEYFGDGKGKHMKFGALRMWGWGGVEEHNGEQFVAMPHEDLLDISNRFPELEVSKPDNVYAAILCLKTGVNPSKTVVWDKIPTREDDLNPDKKKEYWFTYDMIENVDSYAMQLHAGDFGIFPAHKIHAVTGGEERCTLGCFFHIHNGKVIMRT